MKKENNPVSQEKFKTLIGGQALIEGIMMQGAVFIAKRLISNR